MALTKELHKVCIETLVLSSAFHSDRALRAVFVTNELKPFRDGLPQGKNISITDRVKQTIAYLLDHYLNDGRPVFSLFLSTLCAQCNENDDFRNSLDRLCLRVDQELRDNNSISFVIAAMTRTEADELLNETAFIDRKPSKVLDRFREFKKALQKEGLDDFPQLYKKERDLWTPFTHFTHSPLPIKEIIEDKLKNINNVSYYGLSSRKPPRFLSEQFFSDDRCIRNQIFDWLKESGCIFIVDALSMFHPTLNLSISLDKVAIIDKVAILVLSPIDIRTLTVNELIEKVIDEQMESVFDRINVKFDHLCEIGVVGLRSLTRWLCAIVPEIGGNVKKPFPENLAQIAQIQPDAPIGINKTFFSRGGLK